MDYKQKYEEIVEWARKNKARLNGVPIEEVLPELAESEDERIRKALIETVKCIYAGDTMFLSEQQRDRYIDWLEKQLQWKPSEEQINALNAITTIGQLSYAGQGDALISLYQDLKNYFNNG